MINLEDLSQDKKNIITLIDKGYNIFLTGEAGVGKSYLIDYIKEHYKNVIVSASTGVASFNVRGVTIHSLLKIGICDYPLDTIYSKLQRYDPESLEFDPNYEDYVNFIRECRILIIDEISMISDRVLKYIDKALQILRDNTKLFGGVQLIISGDFLQLPPVLKAGELSLLKSTEFKNYNFRLGYLTQNHRQESDNTFKTLLRELRTNVNLDQLVRDLSERVVDPEKLTELEKDPSIIKIVSTNDEVTRINKLNTDLLNTQVIKIYQSYKSLDRKLVLKDFQSELEFKLNSRVMILKNFDVDNGVVNGALGTLVDARNGSLTIQLDSGYLAIIPETFESGDITTNGIMFNLSSIREGYAFTVHKSQGLTFDKILFYNKNLFNSGQFYTAISRVKTLDGLFLSSVVNKYDLMLDRYYLNFYNLLKEKFGKME